MSIAIVSGIIILVLLVIMLVAGVPIAVALGVSSVCAILPVMDIDVAVLTGAQRIFSGISVFSLLAIPFFIKALGSSHVPLLLKEFAIAFMTFVSLVIPKCK